MHRWTKHLAPRQIPLKKILISVWIGMILACLSTTCTKQPATEHLYAPGETVEIDGWQVTVHSFSILLPDPWHQPQEGHVFCAVELTLQNSSGQIRYIMPEKQMTLLDGNGHAYALDSRASVMAARLHNWFAPQGGFDPGQKAYGAAAYQVPANARNLRWTFRGGLLPWSRNAVFTLGDLPRQ